MKTLRSVTVLMDKDDKYFVTYDDMTHEIAKVKVLENSSLCQVSVPGNPEESFWVAVEVLPEQVRREIAYAFRGGVL